MMGWDACRKILCIRADNMGDVLMSSPAFRALKESFNSEITLLTSSMGAEIGHLIPEVDRVMTFDFPWVQISRSSESDDVLSIVGEIKKRGFDGCIVFSVYSQNSLPAAFVAYLAHIPLRLAYCREKPYGLLTHWVPDKEPYSYILHQVERDLRLVSTIGAKSKNKRLSLHVRQLDLSPKLQVYIKSVRRGYFVFHPGVSEQKRRYPVDYWADLGKAVYKEFKMPIFFTGSGEEIDLNREIVLKIGKGAVSVAGLFTLEEVASLIGRANALIAVNTGTVHIAAALQTPVLVLYAQTNPQHCPWMVPYKCLQFSVADSLKSQNEVIRFVNNVYYRKLVPVPSAEVALMALRELLSNARNQISEDLKQM